jgi:hypothetical protein
VNNGCLNHAHQHKASMRHLMLAGLFVTGLVCTSCSSPDRTPPPAHEVSRDSHQRTAADQDKAFKALDSEIAK